MFISEITFSKMNIQENFSLKNYNTFGIDARAKYFASITTIEELKESLEFKKPFTLSPLPSTLILGGGSNILFTKKFEGLVLRNELKGFEIFGEDENNVFVKVAAGENWHQFVRYCIHHSLAGVENLSLIPGSVGASPIQNIGAYGVEIKDVFHSLDAYHINDKQIISFNAADCDFGYRESVFKSKYKSQFVITEVTFRLRKKPIYNISYGAIEQELQSMGIVDLSLQAISQAVINIRTSKLPDPAVIGNAGSFFKNPEISSNEFHQLAQRFPGIVGYELPNENVKLAAGWLIEQCGWKGYRNGDAGCDARQALVLVNYGNATGSEIFNLSTSIIESVKEKFGAVLSREVNVV